MASVTRFKRTQRGRRKKTGMPLKRPLRLKPSLSHFFESVPTPFFAFQFAFFSALKDGFCTEKGMLKRETARAGNGLTCVSLPEKQQFCQKLLADGRPKAFVELFQLTHTVDSEVIPAEVGNDARSVSQQRNVMFNLGKVYWKLQDSLKAINSFEDCLALARTNNNHGRAMLAAENLLEIYWKCAEQSKQVGDHLKSIEYFEKVCKLASMQRH
ncbi:hypothetical protein O6H91_19G053400 [Diphasiastrum complanatum]|uniref:Uncharacterized protein n=1 Tax=Diphasiastrum complanatum TaxID=34168 RepID=A0ACC2AV76_DIPCM|nr:hypothetical protein O6H91_19G053400 [Diphasiastrum complanatum]